MSVVVIKRLQVIGARLHLGKACVTRQEGFRAEQEATVKTGRMKRVAWQRVEERCCHGDAARDACRNTSAMLRVDEEEGSRAWVPREGEKRRQLNRRAKPRQTLLPPAGPEDRLSITSQNQTFQRNNRVKRLTWRYGPETYFRQVCKHSRECLVVASIWRDLESSDTQGSSLLVFTYLRRECFRPN